MNDRKLFIPVLLGTPRKNRESENAAKWVWAQMRERPNLETQLFDVCDFHLPHDHYGQEIKDQFPEWRDAIIRADGLVIVTPEYNHGYPGSLKGVLDLLLAEYIHKAVAFVSVSAQVWGGTRVIEACVPMVRELGLAVTFTDLNFPRIQDKFDDDGNLLDEAYVKRASAMIDELVWMATTLRWGRENVPSRFHSK
jgi:NAD(P)H-dependent FMN reductase